MGDQGKGLDGTSTRPATKPMPYEDMKADLAKMFDGEQVVIDPNDTSLVLQEGESDGFETLEQIIGKQPENFKNISKPKPSRVESEDQESEDGEESLVLPSSEQDQQPARRERDLSLDERIAIHQEQMRAEMRTYLSAFENSLQRYQPQAQTQPVQPKPAEKLPDYMKYTEEQIAEFAEAYPQEAEQMRMQRRIYTLEQREKEYESREVARDHKQIDSNFESALARLKAELPDVPIDKYLPAATLDKAREMIKASRQTDVNVYGWMQQAVWAQHGPELYKNRSQAKQDDLQLQRAKKQAASQTAAALSSGGQPYQPPQIKRQENDRSVMGGREGFLADLKELGFK